MILKKNERDFILLGLFFLCAQKKYQLDKDQKNAGVWEMYDV